MHSSAKRTAAQLLAIVWLNNSSMMGFSLFQSRGAPQCDLIDDTSVLSQVLCQGPCGGTSTFSHELLDGTVTSVLDPGASILCALPISTTFRKEL